MMRKVLQITLLLCLFTTAAFAQTTIPNGGFENWDNATSSTAEPTSWNSNETGTGYAPLGPQTCFRSTTAHSGTYSAQVKSASYFGQVVNGALATGQVNAPTTTKADGYIGDVVGNTGFISTFTGRPDSLIFWYQYTSVSSDYPTVQARLHVGNAYAPETPSNSNHPVCAQNIIARALWTGPTSSVSQWTRVSVPFVYDSAIAPAYILISCTSSGNQNGGSSGSTLLLDDFLAYYNPTLALGTVSTGPFYVSATAGASISIPCVLTGTYDPSNVVTAQLSDASGSFASPVSLGTLTTTASGTISGTIPANTPTGTGYRIRLVSSNAVLTSVDNGSNITINLVNNAIAPSTTQNIAANVNGNLLTVTETPAATSRQWEYSTTSGGPYQAFGVGQTATTYAPDFSTSGTYYVVCVSSYPGSLTVTSNQVQVNVVSNSIAPTSSQSILVGANGTLLTVTESATATSRAWMYATTSGGPYTSPVSPADVSTTYTPKFASAGSYYVVCQSVINGITATSNEVLVTVGSVTITTQAVNGSPFLFSHSAPNASVSVPFTTSSAFTAGNVFTAQLSDATGSFTAATNIGTLTGTTSGTISATIPSTTPAGTGYRIRVIGSNPAITGSDNGTNLIVDQFHNSVTPGATQNIAFNTNGTVLTVNPSQTSTNTWLYSTVSGSGYTGFSPAQTGSTYTPDFAAPGTYYVVCVSTNQYGDADTSNEVEVIVANGSTLTTLAVAGSPYLVSDSSNVQVSVNYTSDVQFSNGNIFQAQLSDYTGSFANPVNIGSLTGTASSGTISAVIPNTSLSGTHYRIRVVSASPALTGTADSTDLTIVQFAVSVSPVDTQVLIRHQNGTTLTATSNQPATYNWQFSEVSGSSYVSFTPVQTADTLVPVFNNINTYYVVCNVTNSVNASLLTPEVVVIVNLTNGINGIEKNTIKAFWDNQDFVVDLTGAKLNQPVLELVNVTGQVVFKAAMNTMSLNRFATQLPAGIYVFKIVDGEQLYTGKTDKK